MKKLLEICLGVARDRRRRLSGDVGSLATKPYKAVPRFAFIHGWAILVGTVCPRLSHGDGRPVLRGQPAYDRRRHSRPLRREVLPVAAHRGRPRQCAGYVGGNRGVSVALEMATGIKHPAWWAFPVALLAWCVLWRSTFGVIEKRNLAARPRQLSFVAAAILLKPDWHQVARGLVPSAPHHDPANYWVHGGQHSRCVDHAFAVPVLFIGRYRGSLGPRLSRRESGDCRFGHGLRRRRISLAVLDCGRRRFSGARHHARRRLSAVAADALVAVFGFWGFRAVHRVARFRVLSARRWKWRSSRRTSSHRDSAGTGAKIASRATTPGFSLVYTCALRNQRDPDCRGRRSAENDGVLDGAERFSLPPRGRSVSSSC